MRASKSLSAVLLGAPVVGGLSVALTTVLGQTTITWAKTATDFNAGASWTGGVAPGSADTARFNSSPNLSFQPVLSANTTVTALNFAGVRSTYFVISGASGGLSPTLTSNGSGSSSAIDVSGLHHAGPAAYWRRRQR